ncbi:MAG: MFS transporter [Bifidobacteriaceae bacterium]|jgi:MFS family permease|nr:MFS transporter [Bifidobacteriaceae bacterium]
MDQETSESTGVEAASKENKEQVELQSSGPTKIWNRMFVSIVLANVFVSIALQISNQLVGKYTGSLGATAQMMGIVSSAFAWSAIVLKLISAPALDTFNRKHILIGAIAAIALAMFGFGISGNVSELFAFRLIQGAGQAFSTTCFVALAADALPREKMGTGLGFFSLGAGVAQMVGPVIALKVAEAYNYGVSFFIAGIVAIIAIFLTSQIKLKFTRTKKFSFNPKNIFAKEVLISALLMVLLFTCYSIVNPFLATYADKSVGSNISFFFTVYAAVLFLSRPLSGKLADKFGYIVLVPMLVLFIGSFFLISVSNQMWMFLLAAVLFGFGYGGCQPVLQSLAMKLVPKSRRGSASATNFLGSDAGNIIGPIVGGGIADALGYSAMWQIMTVVLVVAIIIVIVANGYIKRKVAVYADVQ